MLETVTVFTSACAHEKCPWASLGDDSEQQPNGCDSFPFARVMLESVQHEKTNQLPVVGAFVGLGPGKFKGMRFSQGWDSGLCLKGSTLPNVRHWPVIPKMERPLPLRLFTPLLSSSDALEVVSSLCSLLSFTHRNYLFPPNKMFSVKLKRHQ